MKIKALLFTFFLSIISSIGMAQKDTCKLGLYVNAVYDFDIEDQSFMTDFWIWLNYRNDSLQFEDALEIPSAKTVDFSHYSLEKKGDINWVTQKCKAQIMYQWDVSRFPFDEQHLRITMEDARYDATQLVYIADTANSRIDQSFNSKEWQLKSFCIWSDERMYQTTYGNPDLSGTSSYPRIVAELVIRRNNSWLMLFKMLTGAYVAFLISCLVFFVSSHNQDSRFGLCVGGLFAAIGNKYIVESVVPTSTTTTLMDNVHNLTFTFILVIVGIIIISLYLFESGDEKRKRNSVKLDRWAFFSVVTLYALINMYLIWRSAGG
jgi:hypothetical protein